MGRIPRYHLNDATDACEIQLDSDKFLREVFWHERLQEAKAEYFMTDPKIQEGAPAPEAEVPPMSATDVTSKDFAVSSIVGKIIGDLAVMLPFLLIVMFSYFDNVWTAIPLMERFALLPWLLFMYTYGVCSIYERAQSLQKVGRKVRQKNYRFTLWWGIAIIAIHYAYIPARIKPELLENSFYEGIYRIYQVVLGINNGIGSTAIGDLSFAAPWFGLAVAFYGALRAAAGRIYLNGYWGVHIYNYGESHKIVNQGPYRSVRNPIYQGQFLLVLGTAFVASSFIFFLFAIFTFLMNHARVLVEERELGELFKADYEAYKRDATFRYFNGVL